MATVGAVQTLTWPTAACTVPQSPQLLELDQFHLWEHSLSIQIFHRCRVYKANCGNLTCGLCSCPERFLFLFLSRPTPWDSAVVLAPFPTGVCSRGCPGALGSVPMRTRNGGGMTAWIVGTLAVMGAWERQWLWG